MKDQVLSIERMQKLKELGVNSRNASMLWISHINKNDYSKYKLVTNEYELTCLDIIPTFTLQDMIELMPDKIIIDYENYYLCIDKNCTAYLTVEEEALWFGKGNGILINTYSMLVWLAENKYI